MSAVAMTYGVGGVVVPESGLWGRNEGKSGRLPAYAITIGLPRSQRGNDSAHVSTGPPSLGAAGLEQGRIRQFAGGSIVVMSSGQWPGPSLQETTSDRNLDAASSPSLRRPVVREADPFLSSSRKRSFQLVRLFLQYAFTTLVLWRYSQDVLTRQAGTDRSRLGGWRVSCGP